MLSPGTRSPYGCRVTRKEPVPHLSGLGTTIFAEMSALAARTGAVNLGQGFPDTDGPRSVAQAASDAVLAGLGNQYPPGQGVAPLLEAVAAHQLDCYGLRWDPATEVLVTAGATEGIAAAMLALVDEGDEVIALEPFYDSYRATIAMARGRCVPVRLEAPDFRLEEDRLSAAVSDRTRLILLNSPHNPTGAVLSLPELKSIARVAVDNDLLVVTDEVYEHQAFDEPHIPIATLPGMSERTITLSSAGKTFGYTGWKVGWATGPAELIATIRTTKQYLTFVSGGPFQYAVADALTNEMAWVAQNRETLRARRDLLVEGLIAAGIDTNRPRGTYFATSDVAALGWPDAADFCWMLASDAGVVAIPCSVFYAEPDESVRSLVRWTFSKQESVLAGAVDQMKSADLTRPRRSGEHTP